MSNKQSEEDVPFFTLAQKKSNLSMLEKRLAEIKQRIPKVQQLEIDLGLPEEVMDSELVDAQSDLEKAYQEARDTVRSQAIDEAKEQQ